MPTLVDMDSKILRHIGLPALALVVLVPAPKAHAQFVRSSTSYWTVIKNAGNGVADPSNDQQTGQKESDIVGTSAVPSAYFSFFSDTPTNLTDGTLSFRVRLAEDTQSAGYNGYMWVGIDANNDGAIDLFAGVNRQGSSAENVLRNPGTGANNSPNTTTISNSNLSPAPYAHTTSNYDWSAVGATNYTGTNFDIDGNGANDYFMSMSFPFQDIVNALNTTGTGRPTPISINENSNLRFVIATSQQGNSINQDYNGGAVAVNSTSPFPISDTTSPKSILAAVPEPSTLAFLVPGIALLIKRRRK